jgi:hypothetical protein
MEGRRKAGLVIYCIKNAAIYCFEADVLEGRVDGYFHYANFEIE